MELSETILDQLAAQVIELPSWAFGNSGTRFKVFATAGHAADRAGEDRRRRQGERADRAGAEGRAAHPVGQGRRLRRAAPYAEDLGVALGTVNSNTFQDDVYKFGSLTHVDESVRRKAIEHHFECIEIMDQTGSRDLKIWLADGTNYPGQGDIRGRQDRLADSLAQIYDRIGPEQRLVLEYKFFEPAFYHTDVPDWGTSYAQVVRAGRAGDGLPGHRPPRAGHEHRVHRRAAAAAGKARLVRLQLPLLRRRRPDRRRGRPVPAVPDPLRGGPRRRASARRPTSRSCSTSATTSRTRSPARSARCSTSRR